MGYNPIKSSADETKGKYSRDEPLTFENLLDKQTEADRDPLKFHRDSGPEFPEVAEANNRERREESASTSNSSLSTKDPDIERKREKLAERLLEDDIRGRGHTAEYGSNTTPHSPPRWYSLRRISHDGQEYYYVLCEQYSSTFEATFALLDFGTEMAFEPATFSREVMHEAIEKQRVQDFQSGREPVPRLRPEQLDVLESTYQKLVKLRTFETREGAEERYRELAPLEVYSQFVVDNESSQRIIDEVLRSTLLPQQRDVVTQSFVEALSSATDAPSWVWQQGINTSLPVVAKVTFE